MIKIVHLDFRTLIKNVHFDQQSLVCRSDSVIKNVHLTFRVLIKNVHLKFEGLDHFCTLQMWYRMSQFLEIWWKDEISALETFDQKCTLRAVRQTYTVRQCDQKCTLSMRQIQSKIIWSLNWMNDDARSVIKNVHL